MKEMLALIDDKITLLGKHPLFAWLASDETPLRERMMILPGVVNLAMGFRDVNKWVLRYPQASGDLERGINLHTFEDQTHSRLYLEDWRRLGLDRRLGWQAGDTLWWLFLADDTDVARRNDVHFLTLGVADGGDPLLRFAQAEVGERCARDLFFQHVSAVATRLSEKAGIEYLYFGPHHIDAEGEGAEELFETRVLDDTRRERARELVDAMADVFSAAFDSILAYALTYVANGTHPRRPGPRLASLPETGAEADDEGPVHETQDPVRRLLDERMARTARHPFFGWLHNRGGRVPALGALRRFFPMWVTDVMGRNDLGRHVLCRPRATDEFQAHFDGWADRASVHAAAYLDDWRELGLDELLGWTASDTFEFCYLDRMMDVHRRNKVRMIQLAAGHADPLPRLWLTRALDATARAFTGNTALLAAEVEATTGLRLDYLSGRHPLPETGKTGKTGASGAALARLAMTPAQRDAAETMVTTVFDAFDEQLDISLDIALSNTLRIP
jgi:PAS domain-containing protein